MDNSANVEDVLNQYSAVWSYSISSDGAISLNEMMNLTGYDEEVIREIFGLGNITSIPSDFSTNIYLLNSYHEESGELTTIETVAEEIKEEMSEMNNPVQGYEEAYSELLDLYTYSEEFAGMALNPDGSLQSFTENKDRLIRDITNAYNRIEVLKPNSN